MMPAGRPLRLYRYVITFDANDAPCTDDGLVTLATCKPALRSTARPGDWVAAFLGVAKRIPEDQRGTLSWAGRVASRSSWAEYFTHHPRREDARYAPHAAGAIPPDWTPSSKPGFMRRGGDYHLAREEQLRDLKSPVLIFDPESTWYFGDKATRLPDHLRALVPRGEGHRVAATGEIAEAFRGWIAETRPGIIGSHPDTLDDASDSARRHPRSRHGHPRPRRARTTRMHP